MHPRAADRSGTAYTHNAMTGGKALFMACVVPDI